MRTIILGKEGDQPFPITADGVSRHHARITIDDKGNWMLEDTDSSNGTYIRNESNGELSRVARVSITPMTFICLGPDNAKGCCFYARQVLKENYGNFTTEYEFLNEKEDLFEEQVQQIEQRSKNLNIVKAVLPVILLALSVAVVPGMGPVSWIIRGVASALPTVLILMFYNPTEMKKEVKAIQDKFSHCPNPCCSGKLTSKEIRNMRCAKCKK